LGFGQLTTQEQRSKFLAHHSCYQELRVCLCTSQSCRQALCREHELQP
jgi:hypothetical protein